MQGTICEIVIRDAKVLAGGNAEGERTSCAELIFAGGDGRESFGPAKLLGS